MTRVQTTNGRGTSLLLGDELAWFSALFGTLPRGCAVLLAGDPGAGKSTLAQQLAVSAARAGERALIIATEQARPAIEQRVQDLLRLKRSPTPNGIVNVTDELSDLLVLPSFLSRQVMQPDARFAGTSLIVIDSLHGGGNAAHDRRFYSAYFECLRNCAAARVTTFTVAHMTKNRRIAGPRSLEHAVDISALLFHGISARALTIPKNRHAAACPDPVMLEMTAKVPRLTPSSFTSAASCRVRTLSPEGVIEIETGLSIPRTGRGFVRAPGFAVVEIETVVDLVGRAVPIARSLSSLGVTVRGPAQVRYRRDFSLAIALGLLAGLKRVNVSQNMIVIGDLDLRAEIREPSEDAVNALSDAISAGEVGDDCILISSPKMKFISRFPGEVRRCETLRDACVQAGMDV